MGGSGLSWPFLQEPRGLAQAERAGVGGRHILWLEGTRPCCPQRETAPLPALCRAALRLCLPEARTPFHRKANTDGMTVGACTRPEPNLSEVSPQSCESTWDHHHLFYLQVGTLRLRDVSLAYTGGPLRSSRVSAPTQDLTSRAKHYDDSILCPKLSGPGPLCL